MPSSYWSYAIHTAVTLINLGILHPLTSLNLKYLVVPVILILGLTLLINLLQEPLNVSF